MSSCLNCQERYLGCHDRCEKYQAAKEKNEEMKKKRCEMLYSEYNNYQNNRFFLEKRSHDMTRNRY